MLQCGLKGEFVLGRKMTTGIHPLSLLRRKGSGVVLGMYIMAIKSVRPTMEGRGLGTVANI